MLTEDTLKYGVKYYAASPGLLWQHFGLCDDGGKILSFEDVQIMYSMDDYCVPASVIDFVKRFGITHDNDLQLIARKSFVPLHIIFLGLYSFVSHCSNVYQYQSSHISTMNSSPNCARNGGQGGSLSTLKPILENQLMWTLLPMSLPT